MQLYNKVYIYLFQQTIKTTKMENFLINFDELDQVQNWIFITVMVNDQWQRVWKPLKTIKGEPFTDIEQAIEFVRKNDFGWGVGLADFKNAKLGNASWDNL